MTKPFSQIELNSTGMAAHTQADMEETVTWLERTLPRIMRRLIDSENLDMPLLQLPLAQMRLAQALYQEDDRAEGERGGQTMGRLSERLGVRQNALTQAADRLVNHGLAERISDASDRRIVRLRLTMQGQEWVGDRRARRRAHLSRLWEMLAPGEQEPFLEAVRILEAAGDRLNARLHGKEAAEAVDPMVNTSAELQTVEETLSHFAADEAHTAAGQKASQSPSADKKSADTRTVTGKSPRSAA